MLSIDLARNFALEAAPSVTFTGDLAGGGTVSHTFSVTASSPPLAFQTFDFSGLGFTDLSSVSWNQGADGQGIHQFGNILLSAGSAVPEPSSLVMAGIAVLAGLGARARRR